MTQPIRTIKPDAKGRIYLGLLAEGVSSFTVQVDKYHRIILEPLVEIPAHEKWLFNNKAALGSLKQGLLEVEKGELHDLGSFAKYADENEDDAK